MKRLHIVGSPRSGTTLLMELIVTCFKNNGHCEHEMNIFKIPEINHGLYISKQPSDIKYIEKFLNFDEALFVLYIVRDPRSVISSIHKSHQGKYFCNFRVWKECENSARKLNGHERFLKIKYEDLVQNEANVQKKIINKFPFLEKIHNFSEYEKFAKTSKKSSNAMGGVREISSNRITGWRKNLPRIKSEYLKNPDMVDALIENGYEKDDSWTKILDNITPVKYNCRYPDFEPLLKKLETKFRKWIKFKKYVWKRKKMRSD